MNFKESIEIPRTHRVWINNTAFAPGNFNKAVPHTDETTQEKSLTLYSVGLPVGHYNLDINLIHLEYIPYRIISENRLTVAQAKEVKLTTPDGKKDAPDQQYRDYTDFVLAPHPFTQPPLPSSPVEYWNHQRIKEKGYQGFIVCNDTDVTIIPARKIVGCFYHREQGFFVVSYRDEREEEIKLYKMDPKKERVYPIPERFQTQLAK